MSVALVWQCWEGCDQGSLEIISQPVQLQVQWETTFKTTRWRLWDRHLVIRSSFHMYTRMWAHTWTHPNMNMHTIANISEWHAYKYSIYIVYVIYSHMNCTSIFCINSAYGYLIVTNLPSLGRKEGKLCIILFFILLFPNYCDFPKLPIFTSSPFFMFINVSWTILYQLKLRLWM